MVHRTVLGIRRLVMDDVQSSTAQAPYEKLTDVGYDIEAEKSAEQKLIEQKQAQEDMQLAALRDHPGWKQIREQMEQDIEKFKSLEAIDMSRLDNAKLGEVVRTERMVATKLQEYVNKIDNAVKAVVIANGPRQ